METTLHRQLKELYTPPGAAQEVRVGAFRVDVARHDGLVEIQTASLGALREKVNRLAIDHRLLVVKPIAERRYIVHANGRRSDFRRHSPETATYSRRLSPKRGSLLDVFLELVHFTRAFVHARLQMELLLTEEEEVRCRTDRRRRRSGRRGYAVLDRRLLRVIAVRRIEKATDLWSLLPPGLAQPFDTEMLAAHLGRPRWFAQAVAYCLRQTGAARVVGKRRNALVYACAD